MLESIYARPEEIEKFVNKMNLSKQEKREYIKHLMDTMNQATEKVNPTIGGSGRNKITYFSHVNDYLSFFYDWLMNPQNPQFKNLFFGIAGISALAYGGKSAAEAVKEVGFDMVSLANNHLLDQGVDGVYHTLDVLDEIGLSHVGAYRNTE